MGKERTETPHRSRCRAYGAWDSFRYLSQPLRAGLTFAAPTGLTQGKMFIPQRAAGWGRDAQPARTGHPQIEATAKSKACPIRLWVNEWRGNEKRIPHPRSPKTGDRVRDDKLREIGKSGEIGDRRDVFWCLWPYSGRKQTGTLGPTSACW